MDNLYGRHLLRKYIQFSIPNYQQAVIVSPDAGGAKRATAIADALSMPFALIHKERRPTQINDRQNATMMLVGNVTDRVVVLIDDMADTSNTIVRAAKLLKKEGATTVYALITHGILSGDAIDRLNHSPIDKVVVTNTVDQKDHRTRCPKLEVLEVGNVFAEVRSNIHNTITAELMNPLGYPTSPPWREHQRAFRLQLVSVFHFRSVSAFWIAWWFLVIKIYLCKKAELEKCLERCSVCGLGQPLSVIFP